MQRAKSLESRARGSLFIWSLRCARRSSECVGRGVHIERKEESSSLFYTLGVHLFRETLGTFVRLWALS